MNLDDVRRSQVAALTVTETAEVLQVDTRTVSRACDDGQLPSLRIGRRLLIPRLPLLALLGATTDSEAGPTTDPAIAPTDPNHPGAERDSTQRGPLSLAG